MMLWNVRKGERLAYIKWRIQKWWKGLRYGN
jgi:hypothetical protein